MLSQEVQAVATSKKDGTTMGWGVPGVSPVPPTNVGTGGPDGDFRAAGITAISMDVNNFGPDDLVLRLFFEDFDGPPAPVNLAITLADIVVRRQRLDVRRVRPLAGHLIPGVFGTVEGALTDVAVMRIFHNPVAAFPRTGHRNPDGDDDPGSRQHHGNR